MARKNILFLVHCEEMFRRLFPDPLFPLRLRKACLARKYDEVYALISGVEDYNPIRELQDLPIKRLDWGWGYEPAMFEPAEKEWVISSHGHDWTWVPPEIREMKHLQQCNVFVGGGARFECLADFESVLEHLGVDFRKVHGYIF